MLVNKCLNCGRDTKNPKFCSLSCGTIFNNIKKGEKTLKDYYKNPNYCIYCGKIIELRGGTRVQDIRRNKFCNHSCASDYNNKLKGIIPKKERIPKVRVRVYRVDETVTIGSLYGKGASKYAIIRSKARAKMNFYKVEKECCVCGYSTHIEVHHKKFLNTYSDDTLLSVVNDLNNLIYLCPTHHWEFDNKLINL